MYDKALGAFEKAIEDNFDDSEIIFMLLFVYLTGKRHSLTKDLPLTKFWNILNAALMIEPKGIYYYFMAYIKYDYFERKHFRTSPNYVDALQMANEAGLSDFDIEQLYTILNVARPDCI